MLWSELQNSLSSVDSKHERQCCLDILKEIDKFQFMLWSELQTNVSLFAHGLLEKLLDFVNKKLIIQTTPSHHGFGFVVSQVLLI